MFDWLQVLRDKDGVERIHSQFRTMLIDGRYVFDGGSAAVLGGAEPAQIREAVFRTDQRINQTEQEIRRELLVRGLTHGTREMPHLLMWMSLVKDAERIGDYGKNLLDLAQNRASIGAEERARLLEIRDRVMGLLERVEGVLDSQSESAAREFLKDEESLRRACEKLIREWMGVEGRNLAAAALTCRFMKRVAGHAGNVVTSVVMPLDKLDFHPAGGEDD